jgi:hypothetical protein
MRKKRRQKLKKNLLSKCVLDLNFAPIKGSVFLIFFKSQIRCPLLTTGPNPQCCAHTYKIASAQNKAMPINKYIL